MCRTSRSFGIWRCFSLVLLLGGLASATCSAQAYFWQYNGGVEGGTSYMDGPDATPLGTTVAQEQASALANACSGSVCYTGVVNSLSCSPAGAPTAGGQTSTCTWQLPEGNGPTCSPGGNCVIGAGYANGGTTLTSYACSSYPASCSGMNTCQGLAGQATTEAGVAGPTSMSGVDPAGCVLTPNPTGICTQDSLVTTNGWACQAFNSGQYDSGGVGPGTLNSNCVGTACVQTTGSGAGVCATSGTAGDQSCPGSQTPDTCVSFDDGAVGCTGVSGAGPTAPPAPESSSGTEAAPTNVIQVTNSNGTVTSYYFSSSTVSSSTSAVPTTSGGTSQVGQGGSGVAGGCGSAGESPCSQTDANAAANGDCSADSAGCSPSGGGMPSYDWSSDSWSGATSSFYGAVASGPVGTALGGIASAWPTDGDCPSMVVSLSTVNLSADYGTTFCNIWESAAAPVLTVVMLAIWSIVAVLIFLSA